MDTLTTYTEAVSYSLKSPTFFPESGDGCVLTGIDLRVRVGMFEQELIPVCAALRYPALAMTSVLIAPVALLVPAMIQSVGQLRQPVSLDPAGRVCAITLRFAQARLFTIFGGNVEPFFVP